MGGYPGFCDETLSHLVIEEETKQIAIFMPA